MLKQNKIIAVVDDHPMILEGIKSLIQQESELKLYAFSKGTAFVDFIQENHVDLVLLDIVLHDGNGIDFCQLIKEKSNHTKVVALSNQAERSIIFKFLQNGGNGYILKNADADEIVNGIHTALNDQVALSKEVQNIMINTNVKSVDIPRLTKREKQILQAIANGETSNQIAESLFVSVITVETHRRNLMQKFQAKNMIEAVKRAISYNLID